MNIDNNLAQVRQHRGYSAVALAKAVGVSRQTVYAIEAGSYIPNTVLSLQLARVLEVTVEELFSLGEGGPALAPTREMELLPGSESVQPGQPVQLYRVDRRMMGSAPESIAWNLPPADAVLISAPTGSKKNRRGRVQMFLDDEELTNRLLLAGCDPGMSVLARHAQRAGVELVLAHRNSSQALTLLQQGCVHIAGSHLRDEVTGESNLPAVKRIFKRESVAVVSFAVWEEGFVTLKDNPKRIRSVEDLARKGVTLANREPGSGSRILLDSILSKAGIKSANVDGYDRTSHGHLAAAWRVRLGSADCCIATRAVARVLGLDFIPLITERYDLVIRKRQFGLPAMQGLLDTLSRTAFRRELEGLGGYDTGCAGKRVG
ncbi:MAG: molybdate metabolism transcriptional regulator [Acidobacteria bacterium]|nr:MAG: molybdate metabolism transcriptional regulator [Acidobacteriota bacterium]